MLIALLSLVVSVAYHLQLPLAGAVMVDAVTALLNDTIQGQVEIGELQNVSWEKVVARSVVVRDPQGREVIRIARLAAWPDVAALWTGVIRVDRARATDAEVTLYVAGEDEDTVSLVEAFLPRDTSGPSSEPPLIIIDGIVLDNVLVHGDVPGFERLRVEDVRVEGRVEVEHSVRFRVFDGRGTMTGPYAGRTSVDRIVGHFDTDMRVDGLDFYARAHRDQDRVRARILMNRPDENAPPVMDLRVWVEPLRMRTLAEMEIAEGLDNLEGTYRGFGRIQGATDQLRLSADLTSESGRVHVRGELPTEGALVFEAWTQDELRLVHLVPAAPDIDVSGRVRLSIEPEEVAGSGERERRLHAEIRPFLIDDIALPGFDLDGLVQDDALLITQMSTDHLDGETTATGRVGYDGSIDMHVDTRIPEISHDPNVRRFAPSARGALTASLDIRADEDLGDLRFDGRVGLRNARYGSVRAGSLDVRGHASGTGPAPVLRIEGEAEGLAVSDLRLGHASVSVHGGPGGYEVSLDTADPQAGTRLAVRGRATSTATGLTLDTESLLVDLGPGEPFHGRLSLRTGPGGAVTLSPLVLEREDERVVIDGTYRSAGRDDFDIQMTNLELAQLQPLAPEALDGLGGHVDGHLIVHGDLDRQPEGELVARIREGSIRGVRGIEGDVHLTLADDTLQTEVRLALGDRGAISAEGAIGVTASALRDPTRLMEEAQLGGLHVRADNLDLSLAASLGLADALPVTGRISTTAELSGTPSHLGVSDAVLILDRIELDGWDPLRAKLWIRHDQDRLTIRHAWIADRGGELVDLEGELPLALDDLPEDGRALWRQLQAQPWSAAVRITQRRLDEWPSPVRDYAPAGLSASLSLTAHGGPDGLHADLSAVARFVEATVDSPCAADLRPYATIQGRLDGQIGIAHVTGFFGDSHAVLSADTAIDLPLDQWVREGEVARFPATEVVARLRGAEMAEIPWLCQYGQGPLNANITAKDVLTARPVVGAIVDMPRLRLWESAGSRGEARLSDEFRVHVRAGSSPERDAITACAILGTSGTEGTPSAACRDAHEAAEGEMVSRLRVPVEWTEGEALPSYLEGGRITSWSDFRNVHVEPVLNFVPGIVTGDAVMDGQLTVLGPWDDLALNGQLDVSQGHVQIEGLGQHLHDIEGRLELSGDEAIFPADHPLRARDAGGTAILSGSVGFEGLVPRTVDVAVSVDAFPIRREGMVLAWLTGNATIGGRIEDERTTSTIQTRDFEVQLPEQSAASLQSLEPRQDVLVVGGERPSGALAMRESYPVRVTIDASAPFWVRRNDFAVVVTSELDATYQDPQLLVGGQAMIRRGTFEIFGKRFELQQSTLTFTGGPELDPRLNIEAIYEVPGRSGATVTVRVTGTLTAPEVTFSSTETSDRAEIIGLLVSGGRRDSGTAEQEASQQAMSFLAGLTAGILTLGLRQEFGNVVPVLAIESQGAAGTRIRVGIDANDLIPDFLREVVTGAYIEGFFTAVASDNNAAGTSSGTTGVGGGITLELTFPYNFLMRSTYVPVDNGSVDLLFEP